MEELAEDLGVEAVVGLEDQWRTVLLEEPGMIPSPPLRKTLTAPRRHVRLGVTGRHEAEGTKMAVARELLDILVCPADRQALRLEGQRLVCVSCGRRYPIVDDIPVMLIEEAEAPNGCQSPVAGCRCTDNGQPKTDNQGAPK